ncbi:DUF6906 family protein [Paenibacillus sp. TAB 01]|uniref:DUF6906 family protein n=1 Tax=Paenibacillus sp. TAB 01 TaxID=3368988 RepID=UPI0037533BC8
MKQGKNPTLKQKKAIKAAGLNVNNWLIERDTPAELVLIHRNTDTVRKLQKA